MDTTTALKSTTAATLGAGASPLRSLTDTNSSTSDLFATLLQTASSRFTVNPGSLIDPTLFIPTPVENPAPPPPSNTQSSQNTDNDTDTSGGKKNASTNDNTSSTSNTTTATSTSDTATPVVNTDPALATQLAALQALLLSQQQNTVATTAPTTTAPTTTATVLPTAAPQDVSTPTVTPTTPVTDPTAPVVNPTLPVATNVAPVVDPSTQPVTTTTPQTLAAQIQTAAVTQTPVATTTTTAAPTTPILQSKADVSTTPVQADPTTTATPTASQTTTAAPLSTAARAQSQALTQLLGDTNAIRVAVTVNAPQPTAPTVSVYDHFVGYSMADNVAGSTANGQFGDATPTNALVGTPDTAVSLTSAVTQATIAAAQTAGPSTGQTVTTTPTTQIQAAAPGAVTAVAASSGSADLQSDLGQMGFGQSGLGGNTATTASASASSTQSANQTTTPSQVYDQIKVKITQATKAGLDQVSIQLKPEALGRVDIKLEVSPDGKVHATVTADRQDTLNLLQNDAQGLQNALNDAGLRTDANSLQFNLRGDGSGQQASDSSSGSSAQDTSANDNADAPTTFDYAAVAQQRGGVDTYA